MLKVLFVTSEISPLVKTGGLADVAGALPEALRGLCVDVRVLVPGYSLLLPQLSARAEATRLDDLPGFGPVRLLEDLLPGGHTPLLVVDAPGYFARPDGLYQGRDGHDWPDNGARFGLLSRVAARLARRDSPLAWRPDVVHGHDWQAGLAPAMLKFDDSPAASVFTVHNLAFQGLFGAELASRLELPRKAFRPDGLEYYGQISFLKAGLNYADALTTVSPTYAREIQTEVLGFGLQGLLRARADRLTGILNGIDEAAWDPARDPHLRARFDADSLDRKAENKRALQQELKLQEGATLPLLAVVSRLTGQKGADLILEAAENLLAPGTQLAILGSGDRELERQALALAARHPGRVSVTIGFDEGLAHRIEAGADLFLMPSRFEPCGLNQMYSQRYGTPPVVTATGGLADTVTDATQNSLDDGTATGFVMAALSTPGLIGAVGRALACYRTPDVWRRLQQAGMRRDFGWTNSARRYAELYETVLAQRA